MQLKELLVRLPLFEVLTGDPHLIEVSRVEELRAEMDPLPGTLYLVEREDTLLAWIETYRHSSLFRHLGFVLPGPAEFRSVSGLSDVVVLRYVESRLPLDLSARILRIFYEQHQPLQTDVELLRKEIIEELMRGAPTSMEGLLARANVLGLALEQKRQVLLVDLEDPNAFYLRYLAEGESYVSLVRSRMLSLLREILLNDSSHHVVSLHGTGAVALLDRRGVEEPAILAKKVYEKLRREFGTMTFVVALGNPYPSPGLLAKSYREAQAVLEVCRIYGFRTPWITFESIRSQIFFHALGKNTEVADLVKAVLDPLRAVEPRYRRALLEALVAYLECDRSVRRASKVLGVHPNTLKYRIRRLEELLSLQSVDGERKLLYYIAAKLSLLAMRLSS